MKKKMMLILAGIFLVLLVATAGKWMNCSYRERQELDTYTLEFLDQTVTAQETVQKTILGNREILRRCYTMENGDQVIQGRVQMNRWQSQWHIIEQWNLACDTGIIWYYDEQAKNWVNTPMKPMELNALCVYIETEMQDYFIYMPLGYTKLKNQSMQLSGNRGYLSFVPTEQGYQIRLFGSRLEANQVCDYTVVRSTEKGALLSMEQGFPNLWKNYAQDGEGKWCYDGYYRVAPITYDPAGENVYFRCVTSYVAKSMAFISGSSRCAKNLTIAMLDTISKFQEETGCFLTESESAWLKEDYNIEAGFYDTRWNSDLMLIYLKYSEQYGGFDAVYAAYFEYYLNFAEENHDTTTNGGWLVYDYSGNQKTVHCSLNHQLAEMEVLYRFSDYLGRQDLAQLADRMLLGIEDIGTQWICSDGNLQYAYLDGGFIGQDYPYLTYNDLFQMQNTLTERYGSRNAVLDELMASKLAWMQERGITGYMQ